MGGVPRLAPLFTAGHGVKRGAAPPLSATSKRVTKYTRLSDLMKMYPGLWAAGEERDWGGLLRAEFVTIGSSKRRGVCCQ